MRAFYDRVHREHGLSDPGRIYQRVIGLLQPVPGRRLLDVACGEGYLLVCARRARLRPTGVDLSAEAVRRARARCPDAALCIGAGERLPFPDGTFDYVTSLGSLERYRDMERGLDEMARVAAPAGSSRLRRPANPPIQ